MKKINKIKLYIKESENAKKIAKSVREKLLKSNFEIVDKEYDLALSIGGDGTFLKMIHENNFDNNFYYAGINAGALGYLTNVDVDNIDKFINAINDNIISIKTPIIKTEIITNKTKKELYSLNELIIKKINQTTLKNNIYIDGILLEHFIGDGILISTANGSTAYNLSFNGPIIDNNIDSFVLTPIAPINNKIFNTLRSSIVLSDKREILVQFNSKENICFLNDGIITNVNNVIEIKCFISDKNIQIINTNSNYIKKISNKIIGNEK